MTPSWITEKADLGRLHTLEGQLSKAALARTGRTIIVGGGIGGLYTAKVLVEAGVPGSHIVIIGPEGDWGRVKDYSDGFSLSPMGAMRLVLRQHPRMTQLIKEQGIKIKPFNFQRICRFTKQNSYVAAEKAGKIPNLQQLIVEAHIQNLETDDRLDTYLAQVYGKETLDLAVASAGLDQCVKFRLPENRTWLTQQFSYEPGTVFAPEGGFSNVLSTQSSILKAKGVRYVFGKAQWIRKDDSDRWKVAAVSSHALEAENLFLAVPRHALERMVGVPEEVSSWNNRFQSNVLLKIVVSFPVARLKTPLPFEHLVSNELPRSIYNLGVYNGEVMLLVYHDDPRLIDFCLKHCANYQPSSNELTSLTLDGLRILREQIQCASGEFIPPLSSGRFYLHEHGWQTPIKAIPAHEKPTNPQEGLYMVGETFDPSMSFGWCEGVLRSAREATSYLFDHLESRHNAEIITQ